MSENESAVLEKLRGADAVIVAAGDEFSAAEGWSQDARDERFEKVFKDFKERFGVCSVREALAYEFPSEEIAWAFWSRLYLHYTYDYVPGPLPLALKQLVQNKPYFIVTTTQDMHFQRAGFVPRQVFEMDGCWGRVQCAAACHDLTYAAGDALREMAAHEQNGKVPTDLVPVCPRCQGPMRPHLPTDLRFVYPDTQHILFIDFLRRFHGRKIVTLDLALPRASQRVKAPLLRLTQSEPKSFYAVITEEEPYIPESIAERSAALRGSLQDVLPRLAKNL